MADDLIAVVSNAVAAVKDAPPDLDTAAEIADAGDVVGTREAGDEAPEGAAAVAAADAGEPAAKPDQAADAKAAAAVESTDDFDAIPERDSSGRYNRIPHPRVKVMVGKAVEKAITPLRTELDTVKSHNTQYLDRLSRIQQVEQIMFGEPERFVEILRTIPGYDKVLGGAAANGAKSSAADAGEDIDFSKAPPPDAEGNYTPTGLQALLKWTIDQAKAQAVRETESRLGKRYEPIEKTFKERQEAEARKRQFTQHVNATLEDGRKWRHFPENEDAILKAMQADSAEAAKNGGKYKYRNLREAYEDVVFGRITTDRQKQREEILAELEKAPRATSAGASKAAAAAEPETQLTGMAAIEDAVRRSVRAQR